MKTLTSATSTFSRLTRPILITLLGTALGLSSFNAVAQSARGADIGHISQIYSDQIGNLGVILDVPYSDAIAKGTCPTFNVAGGAWAMIPSNADKTIKATALLAKARNTKVQVVTRGCLQDSDGWLQIESIYILE
jgi:hypothetical protein